MIWIACICATATKGHRHTFLPHHASQKPWQGSDAFHAAQARLHTVMCTDIMCCTCELCSCSVCDVPVFVNGRLSWMPCRHSPSSSIAPRCQCMPVRMCVKAKLLPRYSIRAGGGTTRGRCEAEEEAFEYDCMRPAVTDGAFDRAPAKPSSAAKGGTRRINFPSKLHVCAACVSAK